MNLNIDLEIEDEMREIAQEAVDGVTDGQQVVTGCNFDDFLRGSLDDSEFVTADSLDEGVGDVLSDHDVPTRKDVQALVDRIEALERAAFGQRVRRVAAPVAARVLALRPFPIGKVRTNGSGHQQPVA